MPFWESLLLLFFLTALSCCLHSTKHVLQGLYSRDDSSPTWNSTAYQRQTGRNTDRYNVSTGNATRLELRMRSVLQHWMSQQFLFTDNVNMIKNLFEEQTISKKAVLLYNGDVYCVQIWKLQAETGVAVTARQTLHKNTRFKNTIWPSLVTSWL